MILADKIINLRKKNGWSQEELGEMIGVSRQSISKYEGAQVIPDLDKILKLSQVFGVTTDFLMKDEMEMDNYIGEITEEDHSSVRQISLEEAREYVNAKQKFSIPTAIGTAMCITSPVCLIFLAGLSEVYHVNANLMAGIGVLVLLGMIVTAVATFITTGNKEKEFEYLDQEEFETAYGVDSVLKEMKSQHSTAYTRNLIIGVGLCILSPVPLIIAALAEASDFICVVMTCVLLVMVAAAVMIFITGTVKETSIDKLLQVGDFTKENKRKEKKMAPFVSAYWAIATVVFLGWSFYTNDWGRTWIVWPIAAVAFVAVKAVINAVIESKEA